MHHEDDTSAQRPDRASPRAEDRRREEVLQSLRLGTVAAEINAQRLGDLKATLAGRLTPKERKKRRRLLDLERDGRLTELPSDMQANAARMQRTLLALYRLLVRKGFGASIPIKAIAAEMGANVSTARRGVLDLEAGFLIAVDRRPRARCEGGQGPSGYRPVWSNLRDLAFTQGLQGQLFHQLHVRDAKDSVSPRRGSAVPVTVDEGSQPDELSGREPSRTWASVTAPQRGTAGGQPGGLPGRKPQAGDAGPCEKAPTHGEIPRSHCDSAPSHSEIPPTHSEWPRAHAPARSLSPLLLREDLSSSPSPSSKKEKKNESYLWREIRDRLWSIDVQDAGRACQVARDAGWTAEQAAELLDACERERIAGVLPWRPGAVYWQLCNGRPGSSIDLPRQEDWIRARRDADLAARRRKAEQQQAAEREAAQRRSSQRNELEEAWGELLDSLDPGQLDQLIETTLDAFHAGICRQYVAAGEELGLYRLPLLEGCRRRSVESLTEGQTDSP